MVGRGESEVAVRITVWVAAMRTAIRAASVIHTTHAIRAARALRALILAAFLASLCHTMLPVASVHADAREPGRLMVHLPFDGSITEARGLRAMRAEPIGTPIFTDGIVGGGATAGTDHSRAARLVVSRLSRLVLLGKTPSTGTIMIWMRSTAPDTTASSIIISDPPLNLEVMVLEAGRRFVAAFDDDAGERQLLELESTKGDEDQVAPRWRHVAFGWDAAAGTIRAFIDGKPAGERRGRPFSMPGLPATFEVGAPGIVVDEFRLYQELLSAEQLRTLPGMAP